MTLPRIHRLVILALILLIGGVIDVGNASGSRIPIIRSPTEPGLTLGLTGAVPQLATGSSASVAAWQARARAEGAQVIRVEVAWATIAPKAAPAGFDADSATSVDYDWAVLDSEVLALAHGGFTVLLQLQDAPTWAEGTHIPATASPGSWEPDAADLGAFATALAIRYDGATPNPLDPGEALPRVRYFQAWNEPNLSEYLAPQWSSNAPNASPVSPTIYRKLQNAVYRSVHAVDRSDVILTAGLSPYGLPPGNDRMAPVTFLQHVLCLNGQNRLISGCPGPTEFDVLDSHPYVSGLCCHSPTWHALSPGDTPIPDVYKLVDVLRAGERADTVVPAGSKPVWVTELGWNTDPPNPNADEASPVETVARWTPQALYLLWSQGVSTICWLQLADQTESPLGWSDSYTLGLFYADGTAKPEAASFAFPFLTIRRNRRTVEVWSRAPAAGLLDVQRRISRTWRTILTVPVRARQVIEVPLRLPQAATLRASVAGWISPPWGQSASLRAKT